jgi:hypothetical protein
MEQSSKKQVNIMNEHMLVVLGEGRSLEYYDLESQQLVNSFETEHSIDFFTIIQNRIVAVMFD